MSQPPMGWGPPSQWPQQQQPQPPAPKAGLTTSSRVLLGVIVLWVGCSLAYSLSSASGPSRPAAARAAAGQPGPDSPPSVPAGAAAPQDVAAMEVADAVRRQVSEDFCPNLRQIRQCPAWFTVFYSGRDRMTAARTAEGGVELDILTSLPARDALGERLALETCQQLVVALLPHHRGGGLPVVRVHKADGGIIAHNGFGECTNDLF